MSNRHFGIFDPCLPLERQAWLSEGGQFNRIDVEIGPGDCSHLIAAASANPKSLWVGLEKSASVVHRVLSSSSLPANARVLNADAKWVIEQLIGPDCIDSYHAYFPDPWWKKRHHKRRLFTPDSCAAIAKTLLAGGRVYVMTDVRPRFEELCSLLADVGLKQTPWSRIDDTELALVGSSYERKYRDQKRSFHETSFRKV